MTEKIYCESCEFYYLDSSEECHALSNLRNTYCSPHDVNAKIQNPSDKNRHNDCKDYKVRYTQGNYY